MKANEALSVVDFDEGYHRPSIFAKMVNRLGYVGRSDNRTGKPVADIHYTGYEPRVQYPRLAMPIWAMYETLFLCPEARTTINQLVTETLRNRGEWKESFSVKCAVCGLRMKSAPKDGLCQRRSCRSTVMIGADVPGVFGIAPDDDELAFINEGRQDSEWQGFGKCNRAGQSIWDVLYSLAWDICATDDFYLICVKKYHWRLEEGGRAQLYAEPTELVRGHPNVVRIVADDYGNRGGVFYQCPAHRSKIYVRPGAGIRTHTSGPAHSEDAASYEGWQIPAEVLKESTCGVFEAGIGRTCGLPLRNIHYVATDSGGAAPKQYYFEDECLHKSFFTRTVLYGMSPVVTLFRKLRIMIKVDEYIQTYFEKRRIPRGIVAVNTPRREAIVKLKQEVNRQADDDQQGIPFVAVEGSNQRGWIEFIPFADKLNEMDLDHLLSRCKSEIGKFYGVAVDLQGDTSQGGGNNNDGLMLAVQNRSVESFQTDCFNEAVFPWIAKQFGIKDHYYELNPSEEKDIAHEIQLDLLKLQRLGQQMQVAGLRFKGVDENGEYEVERKPDPNHPAMQPFGLGKNHLTPAMQGLSGGAQPGMVQPGGQQPNAVPNDKQKSLTREVSEDPHGKPSATRPDGSPEGLF